jgi:hypothetical protein
VRKETQPLVIMMMERPEIDALVHRLWKAFDHVLRHVGCNQTKERCEGRKKENEEASC